MYVLYMISLLHLLCCHNRKVYIDSYTFVIFLPKLSCFNSVFQSLLDIKNHYICSQVIMEPGADTESPSYSAKEYSLLISPTTYTRHGFVSPIFSFKVHWCFA